MTDDIEARLQETSNRFRQRLAEIKQGGLPLHEDKGNYFNSTSSCANEDSDLIGIAQYIERFYPSTTGESYSFFLEWPVCLYYYRVDAYVYDQFVQCSNRPSAITAF